MPATTMPWLDDLDEEWVQPAPLAAAKPAPSIEQHNNSVKSRIPRRSSGAFSIASDDNKQSSVKSHSTARTALREVSANVEGLRGPISRSVSGASAGSVVRHDTIERRAQSSSPNKGGGTMEWRKRLVQGEVGYGDQTDLFGPSGLENIFQSPEKSSPSPNKRQNGLGRAFKKLDIMPSSPPTWPLPRDNSMLIQEEGPSDDIPQIPETVDEEPHVSLESFVDNEADNEEDLSANDDLSEVREDSMLPTMAPPIPPPSQNIRQASGQSVQSVSDFSPVFISKHTTLTGEIDYVPVDSQTAKMMQSASLDFESESRSQDTEKPTQPTQEDADYTQSFVSEESQPKMLEVSLPDNLPTGTPPIARLGSFVNTRRGGLSEYGSFKTRPLSPSNTESRVGSVAFQPRSRLVSLKLNVTQEQEEDVTEREEPASTIVPHTPTVPQNADLLSPPKSRHSPSPLKLFGNYDTFTNKKLLRRISQLENLDEKTSDSIRMQKDTRTITEDGAENHDSSPYEKQVMHGHSDMPAQSHAASKLSSFGEGELDEFDFEADLSFPSNDGDLLDQCSFDGSPPPEIMPPGSRTPFHFHVEETLDEDSDPSRKRKLSKRSTMRSEKTEIHHYATEQHEVQVDVQTETAMIDGKRMRSSPVKAPTPKRRRTLHFLELEEERLAASAAPSEGTAAIRPRNPTPHQQRQTIQEEIDDATHAFLCNSPRLQAICEKIEESDIPGSFNLAAQAKAVASEVAAFTLGRSRNKNMLDVDRKRSITTQDFLDEAMHIMSLIRARTRPNSGLGSVDESDEDGPRGRLAPSQEPGRSSSVLRISRPPSREGADGWRPRNQASHDARIVSQLKRFQDDDELQLLDATINSSRIRERLNSHDESEVETHEEDVNIRITGPPSESVSQQSAEEPAYEKVDSFGSNPSVDCSTGRTIGTNSSRKSDNVATLGPETVAHLIPDEVAGMAFDRSQGKWVRIKELNKEDRKRLLSPVPQSNVGSDDDPFGNIPDLSVNETLEQLHIRSAQSFRPVSRDQTVKEQDSSLGHARNGSRESATSRPATRDNNGMHAFTSSTAPSKYSAFMSSQQQPETRATSWSSEALAYKRQANHMRGSSGVSARSYPFDLANEEYQSSTRRVNEPDLSNIEESLVLEDSVADNESEIEEIPASLPRGLPASAYAHYNKGNTLRKNRSADYREHSEMSILAELPDKRLMSVSVSVSRPPAVSAPPSQELVIPQSSSDQSAYLLSDLPDFTVHDNDELRPSEQRLANSVAQHAMEAAGDRYAMAVQNIVKTLTDVEPEEPYWEDLKQVNLENKGLTTLHAFDEFCTRVQDLKISNNQITQLEGMPHTVRWLDASSNSLSSLTAWGHLVNLQYLDISNNDIDCLDGLENLMHLRELKADNNKISLLYGVLDLDGLIKLSARGNDLSFVGFEQCQMGRLEELDLGQNHITQISGLSSLPSLKKLTLDGNLLQTMALTDDDDHMSSRLETIYLEDNLLESLDLSTCPALRYIDIDQNRLRKITGLESLHKLDTLSIRKQDLAGSQASVVSSILQGTLHCRSLYLSSNTIPSLESMAPHHSIENLEAASCGLTTLPADFGLKFPNLRTLNLNFNTIKDPRPLLNILPLENLHIAGNRLSRLRKSVATLAKLTKIRTLDIRDNPLTHGFYPPSAPTKPASQALTCRSTPQHQRTRSVEMQESRMQAYILPAADAKLDDEHLGRLDEDSKLRRRVNELLLANSCKKLQSMDGLVFDRERVMTRDGIFERLVKLGIIKKTSSGDGKGEVCE
ncbi:hypothetical protein MBLNU457_1273t1 [Dothideomycetes sp. NU457]